ncbi:hypothetical protein LXA43DRAFT_1068984 [Ganoderma leucocontextum]|nr:hypothetical protein LXA43DRAFT_1068984 [Ganoderma leucocontextum]
MPVRTVGGMKDGRRAVFEDHEGPQHDPYDHDAAAVPEVFRDNDGAGQEHVYATVTGRERAVGRDLQDYQNKKHTPIRVETLRKMYENDEATRAMTLLLSKRRLTFSEEYVVDPYDPNVWFGVKEARLDKTIAIPLNIGLDAVLPNLEDPDARNDATWSWELDMTLRNWEYRGETKVLGTATAGDMACLGKTRNGNEVWLILADPSAFTRNHDINAVEYPRASTRMDPTDYRIVMSLLAYMLAESHYGNMYVTRPYPEIKDDPSFNKSTPLLKRKKISLSLEQAVRLNRTIQIKYTDWYKAAPLEYKRPIFEQGLPMFIVVQYGQNSLTWNGNTDDREAFARYWRREFDFTKLARLAIAIPVHYTAHQIEHWDIIDPQAILAKHGVVYTSPNTTERLLIDDLDDYDLFDERDRELRIYSEARAYIPRRKPRRRRDGRPHPWLGMLQDLGSVRQYLFSSELHIPEDDDDSIHGNDDSEVDDFDSHIRRKRSIGITPYFHFFSQSWGQWQADDIPAPLYPVLRALNKMLRQGPSVLPCVQPQSSQCYNTLAHHTRERARFHIAQQGMLTAAAGAAWATTDTDRLKAKKLFEVVDESLPHERLETQIINAEQSFLRIETNLVVYPARFHADYQDGEDFYNTFLEPWIKGCANTAMQTALRRSTVMFAPGIFPDIYLWASYPLTSFLTSLWHNRIRGPLRAGMDSWSRAAPLSEGDVPLTVRIEPQYVDLIALVERGINFCHTGAARVLSKSAGNPLWFTRALLDGFLPMFSPTAGRVFPDLPIGSWPVDPRTGQPVHAAERALTLSYGNDLFQLTAASSRKDPVYMRDPVQAKLRFLSRMAVEAFHQEKPKLPIVTTCC